jgi:hypothetical protein
VGLFTLLEANNVYMPTFQKAYTDLMDMVCRPLSDIVVLAAAKREINQAVRQIQRERAYKLTERLFTFTYPANTLLINLDSICEGTLRDLQSVQLLSDETKTEGILLDVKTYPWLQAERGRYQKGQTPVGWEYQQDLAAVERFSTTVTKNNSYYVVRVGNGIVLYPTPKVGVPLLVNCHIWLPELEGDEDTNFLLEYGYDVILAIAQRRMTTYLKQDSRFMIAETEVKAGTDTLNQWDSQVQMTPMTDPRG